MMDAKKVEVEVCHAFCKSVSVNRVPCGLAISTAITDASGDRLGFYLIEEGDRFRFVDDGDFLPHLVAAGVDFERGQRAQVLEAILTTGDAFWDRDTYEIKSTSFAEGELFWRLTKFLSALIRARDLEYWTKDAVRSTFKEDATAAIYEKFQDNAEIEEDVPIDSKFREFPADLIIRPREGKPAAVYLVSSNDNLNEALLLHAEAQLYQRTDFSVFALIEDNERTPISRRKLQRAQNRLDAVAIFRGDEAAALALIGKRLKTG